MRNITVLLTGVGAPGAPGIINCLRKNGEREIRIVGVDMNEYASSQSLVDQFYVIPSAKNPKFMMEILDICKKEKVDIIQPIVTKELEVFARNRDLLDRDDIIVNVMNTELLKVANDKGKLLSKLRELNIETPEFYLANTVTEIEKAFLNLGYPDKPVCIKITDSNGSRGLRIVDPNISRISLFLNNKPNSIYISYSELIGTLNESRELPEMMIMEFLPGNEYSVDVLADNGEVVYAVNRRGTTIVNSIQLGCVVEKDNKTIELSKQVTELLKLDGNFGLDIKEDINGRPQIMEINPRLTAGIVACAAAGVNLPYLGIKKILGEELPNNRINYGTKMLRRWEEVFLDKDNKIIEL